MKMTKGKGKNQIVCDVDRNQRELMEADGWKRASEEDIADAPDTGRDPNDNADAGDRNAQDAQTAGDEGPK